MKPPVKSAVLATVIVSLLGALGTASAQRRGGGSLSHLSRNGYSPGPVNGEMGEETASALRDFQMDQNLPVTGQLDSATSNALRTLVKQN